MKYEWQHVVLWPFQDPNRLEPITVQDRLIRKHQEARRKLVLKCMKLPEGLEPADGLNGAWKPIAYVEAENENGVLWRRLLVSGE